MSKDIKFKIPILILLLATTGCSSYRSATTQSSSSQTSSKLFQAVRTTMTSRCLACHADFGKMDEASWISSGYVTPGNPASSPLFQRLNGANLGGPLENMPSAGMALAPAEVDSFKSWIIGLAAGASGEGQDRFKAAQQVITISCGSCHNVPVVATSGTYNGATVPAFANFTTENEYVISGLIVPQSTSQSWLYQSLSNYGSIGGMPQGSSLNIQSSQVLKDWIEGI